MMTIGSTISLAGNPRMNAIKITPSNPISWANGSKKFAQWFSRLTPPTVTLAIPHSNIPAGAATATARPNTKRVRSQIDRTMTLPIWGFR